MTNSTYATYKLDAVEFLRQFPDASVDLVVTDPAYESLEKHRKVGTTTRLKHSKASSNDWFQIFPNSRFPEFFAEVFRVLKKDRHFYMMCDSETMFVAKPLGEEVGFKFWKDLIWDKCLGPETPVITTRGVIPIKRVIEGDEVAIPEGGFARVRATRRVSAPAVEISLSDGTKITASRGHRFVLEDGRQIEASELVVGNSLAVRSVRASSVRRLDVAATIPETHRVYELPDNTRCLWCGRSFETSKGAAAHQARFCEHARSKAEMATTLGVSAKRLRRWMHHRRIRASWARKLGIEDRLTRRVQCYLQNNVEVWYPEYLDLNYPFGKVVGLFAAEGSFQAVGVVFALHTREKHLQNLVASYARSIGTRTKVDLDGNRCVVKWNYKLASLLLKQFVGGTVSTNKFFRPLVYGAPSEFRQGVFDGLMEGDGHWSHTERRWTLGVSSLDLALFAHRYVYEIGGRPRIARFENNHAGGWRTRYDPVNARRPIGVTEVRPLEEVELVDISIDHPDELFLLGNGVVTHNCAIGMGYHWRAQCERILFFEKGKRKLNNLGWSDVISVKRIRGGYPTEKPIPLLKRLIANSTQLGELVVDPFMGSGVTGVAALQLGRRFMGSDIGDEAISVSNDRLMRASLGEPVEQ